MSSKETKKIIENELREIIKDAGSGHDAYLIRQLAAVIGTLVNSVIMDEETLYTEELPLKAPPFQPECKCNVIEDENGHLTIYHCQYHRSIAYVHDELVAISKLMEREYTMAGRDLIIDLLSFISECKKNSLTGRVGKPEDKNVRR